MDLFFLLALLCTELLVLHQVFIDVRIDWIVVKHSLLFESFFERRNYFVKGLAVIIVLLFLVPHDLTNWDGEDTDELAGEALEDLVIDSAGHRRGVQII